MEYADLDVKDTRILTQAIEASRRLYVEGIQNVGAALRTKKGLLFTGIHLKPPLGDPFSESCPKVFRDLP